MGERSPLDFSHLQDAQPERGDQAFTDRKIFWEHVAAFAMFNLLLGGLQATTWPEAPWGWWVPLGWGAALALHGLWAYGKLRR